MTGHRSGPTATPKLLLDAATHRVRSLCGQDHGPAKGWLLALTAAIGLLLLLGGLAACSPQAEPPQQEEPAAIQFSTLGPETVIALTSWPTPPAAITRPPSPTAAPRPLWIAPPQATITSSPTAVVPTDPAQAPASTPVPVGSNPLAVRLLVPSLGLDVPVVEVSWNLVFEGGAWQSVWQTASGAAGHHRNSANPGEAGNVVISGHHNTQGEVFRQVSEIGQPGVTFDEGDEIILVAEDGRQYRYVVVHWERFEEEGISAEERQRHARYLTPTSDATLTLVTCWPYESRTHRVVVVAKLQP